MDGRNRECDRGLTCLSDEHQCTNVCRTLGAAGETDRGGVIRDGRLHRLGTCQGLKVGTEIAITQNYVFEQQIGPAVDAETQCRNRSSPRPVAMVS